MFVLFTGIKKNFQYFTLYDSILNFVILVFILCFRFGICVSFLGFVVRIFLIGHHIFDRRMSVHLSTQWRQLNSVKHFLTIQVGKRLNYLRI